jgi:hypothetical protein
MGRSSRSRAADRIADRVAGGGRRRDLGDPHHRQEHVCVPDPHILDRIYLLPPATAAPGSPAGCAALQIVDTVVRTTGKATNHKSTSDLEEDLEID